MTHLIKQICTDPCQRVDTKEECESLAKRFGLPDRGASTSESPDMPPKCYYQSESKLLWFNSAVAEIIPPCTDTRICVCTDGLQPALRFNGNTEESGGQEYSVHVLSCRTFSF